MNIAIRLVLVIGLITILFSVSVAGSAATYQLDRPGMSIWKVQGGSREQVLAMTPSRVTSDDHYWEALAKLVQLANLSGSPRRALARSLATRQGGPKLHRIITGWLLAVRIEDLYEATRSRATGELELKFHDSRDPGRMFILQYKRERSGAWRFDNDWLCVD